MRSIGHGTYLQEEHQEHAVVDAIRHQCRKPRGSWVAGDRLGIPVENAFYASRARPSIVECKVSRVEDGQDCPDSVHIAPVLGYFTENEGGPGEHGGDRES